MRSKSSILETIKLALFLLTNKEKKKLIFLSFFAFLASLLEVFTVMCILPFLSILFDPQVLIENKNYSSLLRILGNPEYEKFILIFGFFIISILFISSSLTYLVQIKNNRISARSQERLSNDLFRLIISSDYEWHVKQNSTLLMTLFIGHCAVWSKSVIRQIPILVGNLALILIPCFSLTLIAPKFGLLFILFLGSIILYSLKFIRKKTNQLSKISKSKQEEVSIFVNEIFQGIKDVKLSSRELVFLKKFKNIYHYCSMTLSSINNWNQLPSVFIGFLSQVAVILIGTLLIFLKFSPKDIISIMAIVVLISSKIIPAINRLGNSLTGLTNTNSWIRTLCEIVSSLEKYKKTQFKKLGNKLKWSQVTLDNISYKYPSGSGKVINSVKLEIKEGMHYAFVGLSGSGKSTLIDLILGLLPPSEGVIKVDNIPLENLGIKQWQEVIGYVPQKPLINNCSLKENIAFGIDKVNINKARVLECIKLASLSDLVDSLPNGIDSNLGDRGKFLSGGQQQRVAIARALYDKPKILIFDEVTSSQDSRNENRIRKSIENLKGKITILTISHRFYTIKNCDHIFVLENGEIKEEGTYEELYSKSEYFRELEGSIKEIN